MNLVLDSYKKNNIEILLFECFWYFKKNLLTKFPILFIHYVDTYI